MAAKRPARSSVSTSPARPTVRGTKAAAKTATSRNVVAAKKKAPAKKAARAPAAATPARAPRKVAVGKPAATAKPAKAKAPAKVPAKARAVPALERVVLDALADMKAVDVKALDVRGITDITDMMVVASGTSDRHVKSIADRVVQRCKEAGFRPFGIEGERDGEWVLLDLHDLVLHVMLPRVREFYALEKLWEGGAARRA
jgi:ribosome silencing factor RsfS/YbeB/iojap